MSKIVKIEKDNMQAISHLFEDWNETLLQTCMQGYMGTAYADSGERAQAAQITVGDFVFFAGDSKNECAEKLIRNVTGEHSRPYLLLISKNDTWNEAIEKCLGTKAVKKTRYAIKKAESFDKAKLKKYEQSIAEGYELKMMDEKLYHQALSEDWSKDLCANFGTYEHFSHRGIGVAAVYNGKLVCGASSYTYYDGGIEIEIVTHSEHRQKGLATAAAARLISECVEKGLYPSWDAANLISVRLAQKLGYSFDREYTSYEVKRN